MQLALSSLNIPVHCLSALLSAGFRQVSDVHGMSASVLASQCSLGEPDCSQLLSKVESVIDQQVAVSAGGISALALLEQQEKSPMGSILTFVQEMDEMLGTGVPLCKITEFCGAPGVGKTQLGIQLAVDVQLPACFGGVAGDAIYVDTEGSFVPERVIEIGSSFVERVRHIGARQADALSREQRAKVDGLSEESILTNIHYFRCHNYIEQIALCNVLREKIRNDYPATKLIVIDSVAFHFRRDWGSNYGLRNRLLNSMARELLSVANEFQLAVVMMNQVTTKIRPGFEAEIAPALGEAWGHTASNRIMLYKKHGMRYAKLFKSADREQKTVGYQITEQGVRSAPLM